jgi:hypothetical protein
MPRRVRPLATQRSEHWLRIAVNQRHVQFDHQVKSTFGWPSAEQIKWLSPIQEDAYAEYYDDAFLQRLGLSDLTVPLKRFWPAGGPRWDGLARTGSGKVILIEAKAYIEEAVDYRSRATGGSLTQIAQSLADAKKAFAARSEATWDVPFYQYANRLAHLHFLAGLNKIDAYLLFVYFAGAPDVPRPCATQEWEGAIRLVTKCLGIEAHKYRDRFAHLVCRANGSV